MGVSINLSLCLPRDEVSVPLARHICSYSMREIGVKQECVDAVNLALTEACTNVLDHSQVDETYEVYIGLDDHNCTIRVKDLGAGFDHETHTGDDAPAIDLTAESGRGIELMKILVDKVKFESRPEDGMVVHLEKQLEFDESHPVAPKS